VGLWPLGAMAQQPQRLRQVGVLMSYLENDAEAQEWLRVFVQALETLVGVTASTSNYITAGAEPVLKYYG
jgi:hypothetical protein